MWAIALFHVLSHHLLVRSLNHCDPLAAIAVVEG
jgi:hypothetical protein